MVPSRQPPPPGPGRRPRRRAARLIPVLFLLSAVSGAEAARRVCNIEISGNRRLSRDAFLFELRVKEGDAYDEAALQKEFRRLYARGLFRNIRLEVRRSDECADLRFTVAERPTIIEIDYDSVKALTRQNIEDAYRERKVELRVGVPYDRKVLYKAEKVIADLLGQKGFLAAEVEAREEFVSESSRRVHFEVRTGPKTKIRKIQFVGNEVYSGRRLRKSLKLMRPWRWWWPFGAKTLYHPLKYQQDIQNVYDLYRSAGYLDIDIKPPVVEVRETDKKKAEAAEAKATETYRRKMEKYEKRAAKAREKGLPPPDPPVRPSGKGQRRWVFLSVRTDEGEAYDLGEITVEGNQVLDTKVVRAALNRQGMRPGQRLDENSLKRALELIRSEYGRRGYIYADVGRRIVKREEGRIADVVVSIDEDKQYYVDRVDFEGNNVTQDRVLRRELRLVEGDLMNRVRLDVSMLKLSQLGFWKPTEEPILEPIPGEDRVRVRIRGQEQNRNEIQVGGGYSELEGAFFAGSFRTSNFLGRGETVGFTAQLGGRATRYQVSFLEPWFLGRPYTLGFNLFRQETDFGRTVDPLGNTQRLRRFGTGGRILIGRLVGNYSQIQLAYAYEEVEQDVSDFSREDLNKTTIASLTPIFSYNTTNDPWRPTRGLRMITSVETAMSGLGSQDEYLKPSLDITWYRPFIKRTYLGFHARTGFIEAIGDENLFDSALISGVPRFERFYLGGDLIGPRVYETRSLSPVRYLLQLDGRGRPLRDVNGNPLPPVPVFVGGSKQLLLQMEYAIPLGKPAVFVLFFDAGNAFDNGDDINFSDLRMSAGLEARLYLPVFQAPIRLIYGWPINDEPGDQTSRFQFSIGSAF